MGAIGPKGKISRSRSRMKTASAWRVATPTMSTCNKCGELKVPHRACKSCLSYKKQSIFAED
ncbi:MAG: 50S ribosomal protein L32 [Defluviitaleaceae bacterium]|nr:50S ribosomal protein L32 [Defluviitaleaceae bacterium]